MENDGGWFCTALACSGLTSWTLPSTGRLAKETSTEISA